MNWIWTHKENNNSYAEFKTQFAYTGGAAKLYVSADYKYEAYVNGKFVGNCQYADLPAHKSVDERNITEWLNAGENTLLIRAFHMGEDFSVCRAQSAGVAFRIENEGKLLTESSENTLCREAVGYKAGDRITSQLGYGWNFDFADEGQAWQNSRLVDIKAVEEPRPIKQIFISDPLACEVCAQGIFRWRGGKTLAEKMQNSWLATSRFAEITGENRIEFADLHKPLTFKAEGGDGVFVIVDLKAETSGYLTFSLSVDKPCKGGIGWGEHLSDLRIRTEREGRNFAAEFNFVAGKNTFEGYLHRLGCRYLCLYIEAERVTIDRLTVREAVYPFKMPERDFGDRLLNAIYETGRRTMQLCAHEHYEDCPWREQALYGMDSRNQMLFGYGAFEEYDLPRAAIRLQAYSVREEDGLLSLCSPSRSALCIPSFSLYWILALCENAEVDFDEAFAREMLPYAERMLKTFASLTTETGVTCLVQTQFWNFYEWSEGLDGGWITREHEIEPTSDAILTALTYVAARKLATLADKLGNAESATEWFAYAKRLENTFEAFYDAERGLYASFLRNGNKEGWHAYTQAAMIMTGLVDKQRKGFICDVLKEPEGRVVDMTFAALQLKYDAIIENDGNTDWCINDICKIFGGMLFKGATTYWETGYGEADFNDAGSLCHGWSSVACYVFDKYLHSKK